MAFVFAFALIGGLFAIRTFAATTSVTYKAKLTKGAPTKSYSITTSGGVINAKVSSAKSKGLILTVKNSSGATVATAQAGTATSATVNPTVSAGTYTVVVSLNRAPNRDAFTLKITYPVPDPVQPTVLITSPTNTDALSGTVTLAARVSGGTTAPTAVDFAIDGAVVKSVPVAPYTTTYDTTRLTNDEHTLLVTARFGNGSTATSSIPISVSNTVTNPPPPVTSGYPDATNTGVKAGVTRTNSGSITTSSDGQVIQNLNVSGSIRINHNNVTIRNVKFTNPDGPSVLVDPAKSRALIEDCEMDGTGNSGAESAVGWSNYTIRRCNIHNYGEGLAANGGTVIEDNYFHDFTNWISSGAHQDGIQVEWAGGDVIRHNTILMNVDGANANIHVSGNPGAALVENNLLGATGGKEISAAYGTWRNNKMTDRLRTSGALSRIFEYGFPHTICGTTFFDGPNAGKPVEGNGAC